MNYPYQPHSDSLDNLALINSNNILLVGANYNQLALIPPGTMLGNSNVANAAAAPLSPTAARNVLGLGSQIGFLLKWGIHTASIVSVARTSNVATVTTSVPHGMLVGQKVDVNAMTDNTFDVTNGLGVVLSIPSPTSFTYASSGTNKATTADTGTLSTWEVVNDAAHAPTSNARLSSITASAVTVTWDSVGAAKVVAGSFGNHQNNGSAILTPFNTGLGLTTAGIALRFRRTLFGRAYWNGVTTGGGVTAGANWVREGDSGSASFDAGQNAMFIAHSSTPLPTSGSLGVASWPLPILVPTGGSVVPMLPNYQVSPFTAAGYRPSATGFYCRLYNSAGTLLDQTALQAITPASAVQICWSRTCDVVLPDHTYPGIAVTVFQSISLQ